MRQNTERAGNSKLSESTVEQKSKHFRIWCSMMSFHFEHQKSLHPTGQVGGAWKRGRCLQRIFNIICIYNGLFHEIGYIFSLQNVCGNEQNLLISYEKYLQYYVFKKLFNAILIPVFLFFIVFCFYCVFIFKQGFY